MNATQATELGKMLARLTRPQNALYPALLAGLYAHLSGADAAAVISCGIMLMAAYAVAATYNNIQDVKIDAINKRTDNPLVTHVLPHWAPRTVILANSSVIVLLQLYLAQPASLLVMGAYFLLLFCYSEPHIRLQARGWWAILSLALCYGALPAALGAMQGADSLELAPLALLQILLLSPTLLAKDYKDEKGDRAGGKQTPLVRYGATAVTLAAYGLALAACALLLIIVGGRLHLITALGLAAAYLLFVYALHRAKGRLPFYASKLASVGLLGISLLAALG